MLLILFTFFASFSMSFRCKAFWRIGIAAVRTVEAPSSYLSFCGVNIPSQNTFVHQRFQLFHSTKSDDKNKDDEYDIVAVKAKDVVIPLDK